MAGSRAASTHPSCSRRHASPSPPTTRHRRATSRNIRARSSAIPSAPLLRPCSRGLPLTEVHGEQPPRRRAGARRSDDRARRGAIAGGGRTPRARGVLAPPRGGRAARRVTAPPVRRTHPFRPEPSPQTRAGVAHARRAGSAQAVPCCWCRSRPLWLPQRLPVWSSSSGSQAHQRPPSGPLRFFSPPAVTGSASPAPGGAPGRRPDPCRLRSRRITQARVPSWRPWESSSSCHLQCR